MVRLFWDLLSSSGVEITGGGVVCDEPSRALRKLESALRLQMNRIGEFNEGLETYLETSLDQVVSKSS
jgi:hypothetical protein